MSAPGDRVPTIEVSAETHRKLRFVAMRMRKSFDELMVEALKREMQQ